MNAYTLVGPTKRYPCDFNCFANASACVVDLGRSATDRGARLRVVFEGFESGKGLGGADMIAGALVTGPWNFPTLPMIEGSLTRRLTAPAVIAGTLGAV